MRPAVTSKLLRRVATNVAVRGRGLSILASAPSVHGPARSLAPRSGLGRRGAAPLGGLQRRYLAEKSEKSDGAADGQQQQQQQQQQSKEAEGDEAGRKAAEAEAGAESSQGASEEASASSSTASAAEAEAEGAGADAAAEDPKSPEEALKEELAAVQEKVRAKKNDLLLEFAGFENAKKKYATEVETRTRNSITAFARRLLDVQREFDTFPESGESDACQSLHEGVAMTRTDFAKTLDKFDVRQLAVEVGQPVVTARHEVVSSVAAEGVAENMIAEVAEAGWMFEPKGAPPTVLRKAQVRVAKSDAPPAPSA